MTLRWSEGMGKFGTSPLNGILPIPAGESPYMVTPSGGLTYVLWMLENPSVNQGLIMKVMALVGDRWVVKVVFFILFEHIFPTCSLLHLGSSFHPLEIFE